MYLKSLKLTNYRKFSTEQNEIEFISSKLIKADKKIENQNDKDIVENDSPNEEITEIDVASDTTLIIGKNNAGKTTIITSLATLINQGKFGINDFNYRYLQRYLKEYDINDTKKALRDILPTDEYRNMSFFVEYENVIMILGKDFGQDKGLFELFFKEHGEDIDQDLPKYEKYDRGRNILYVAVTRAIKNLRILYIDDLEEVRHNIEKIFGKAEAFPNQMT